MKEVICLFWFFFGGGFVLDLVMDLSVFWCGGCSIINVLFIYCVVCFKVFVVCW